MGKGINLEQIDTWPRRDADGKIFAEALTGCVIVGAEPIDYPITDGILLYLIDQYGEPFAVEIGTNLNLAPSLDETEFYTKIAWRPQEPAEAAQDGGGTKGPPRRKKP